MDESPTAKITNTWSVSVQSNKIAKVRLTNSSSLDKLSNQTVTSAYVHDSYGNVTKETINYGGGVTTVTDQTYYNSLSGSIYMIGQPVTKTMTNTRGGSSWVDKETYTITKSGYLLHRLAIQDQPPPIKALNRVGLMMSTGMSPLKPRHHTM